MQSATSGDSIGEALPERVHAVRRQRQAHLHATVPNPALGHGNGTGPRDGHDVHLRRPPEPEVEVVDAEPRRPGHRQHAIPRRLHDALLPQAAGLLPEPVTRLLDGRGHRRARGPQPGRAGTGQLSLGRDRDGRADAVAEVGGRERRIHPRPVVHGEPQAGLALAAIGFGVGSLEARPDEAQGGHQRRAPRRRRIDATSRGFGGDQFLDALQVGPGQDERGEEELVVVGGGRELDELIRIVGGRAEGVVEACRVGDECPVDDGWDRWRSGSCGAAAAACGPGVEEVRGGRAVAGGVVHGHAQRQARGLQHRGLQREHGAALRQRRREWGEPGNLPGLVGGEAVDAVIVLGDGEGDGVAGAVVELVPVGRAGGEPQPPGEREERAESLGQGALEVRDDGVCVGAGVEAVEEDALDRRGVEPEDVEEGQREGRRLRRGGRCGVHEGGVDDADGFSRRMLLLLLRRGHGCHLHYTLAPSTS
ncbi:hypothetical protein PR202_gb16324 [Eleusine coracana subsp. coracana]|uniref:Uncharacterized protein n=1 Tax=Eleusine coracana subsp. coracana TaxID=191504 RepID=A0AAV5F187_ELECO|nr:hypothetical protein PR202_gb16324 [Eleusine coracana subsp. coracana]